MKEVQWRYLHRGATIVDKSGKHWQVESLEMPEPTDDGLAYGHATLKAGNVEHRIEVSQRQLVRVVNDAQMMLRKYLGAEPIPWPVPATISRLSDMRSHLKMMHGMYVEDVKTLAAGRYAHEKAHETPEYHDWVVHVHSDKPFENVKDLI